jgi:hypothetical protein
VSVIVNKSIGLQRKFHNNTFFEIMLHRFQQNQINITHKVSGHQLWLADITESPLTSSAPTGGCRHVCNNLLKISGQQTFQSLCSEFLLHSWKQQKDSVMKLVHSPERWLIEKVDTILMKAATELEEFQFTSHPSHQQDLQHHPRCKCKLTGHNPQ